jgi:hypothetical protein
MEGRDILRSIEPLQGRVVPIKTVQETQTTEEFGTYLWTAAKLRSFIKNNHCLTDFRGCICS